MIDAANRCQLSPHRGDLLCTMNYGVARTAGHSDTDVFNVWPCKLLNDEVLNTRLIITLLFCAKSSRSALCGAMDPAHLVHPNCSKITLVKHPGSLKISPHTKLYRNNFLWRNVEAEDFRIPTSCLESLFRSVYCTFLRNVGRLLFNVTTQKNNIDWVNVPSPTQFVLT